VLSGSYFFARMNRIGSVVELKFYIRVQEEDIRVQKEIVSQVTTEIEFCRPNLTVNARFM